MNRQKDGFAKEPFAFKRSVSLLVVLLNAVLLVCAALFYGNYAAVYQERLREENLGNIANLNQSAALNATALFDSWDTKLEDVVRYINRHPMTRDDALVMIEQSNSRPDRQFELIGGDYTGYLAQRGPEGGFIPLAYQGNSYEELQAAVNDVKDEAYQDVCFAPEFTDGYTALKYFAVYRHLPLIDSQGREEIYTLLLATKSSQVLAVFNSQNDFEGQATVLIDEAGNYIVSSKDFRSNNFFQYLYVYNDLHLDQRSAIQREVAQQGEGELYFQDALGRDCVFRYERMTTNDWYCVTCVPIASFRTPVLNASYAIYAVLALLVLLGVDVTWLRLLNRRLRQSVQREKEASEAKTEFLSRMSHDIRTPLNGIIGLTALALDENVSPKLREYLDNIKVSGQFLTGLVNDILDLSKVESGKVELNPEAYACRDMCKYAEAVVLPLCREKGVEFRVSQPDEEPPVRLDRLRFNQVIFNLLSNAVKYTPAGGFVELTWKRANLLDGGVALEITVRDNGIGMSKAFQEHMFESFTQEHSQTANTGSGLGLAIVYSLVKLMGGSIEVQSEQGKGSSFTLHLTTTACGAEEQVQLEPGDVGLEGRRVLLCEDNPINTMVAQKMLEKWGVIVDTAENGQTGLEKFTASAPGAYDAILMDVMMPVMNGLEATQAIRGLDRPDAARIPILAMTANAYDTDVRNCLAAGMNEHMGKPIDREQLQAVLARLIAGGTLASGDGRQGEMQNGGGGRE